MTNTGETPHDKPDVLSFEDDALQCLDDVARFARSPTCALDDADDVVQETYLRAFRSRHTWREGADMRRWLFTICKNVFRRDEERVRSTVARDGDPTEETLSVVRLHNTIVANGESSLFDRIDVGPAIARAVQQLADSFQFVGGLVDMEGYGYIAAAEMLGIPFGTVRSRLFRARRVLLEALLVHARDAGLLGSSGFREKGVRS